MAQVGVASHRPSAAVLGIAGVTATDDDFQLVLRGFRRSERGLNQAGRTENRGLAQQAPTCDWAHRAALLSIL